MHPNCLTLGLNLQSVICTQGGSPALAGGGGPVASNDYALTFDGTNDYASMAHGATNNFFSAMDTGDWSLSFYLNLATVSTTNYVFLKGTVSPASYITIRIVNGVLAVYSVEAAQPLIVHMDVKFNTSFSNSTWSHILITSDASGPTRVNTCYQDGSAVTIYSEVPTASSVALSSHVGSTQLEIAGFELFPGYRIAVNMDLDETAMWDKVLTAAEVSEIYTNTTDLTADSGIYASSSNLQFYYRMEEGSGTVSADSSGNGNGDITLVNGTTYTTATPF